MRTRLSGRLKRLPFVPPQRITEPIDMAIPQHTVEPSGLMKRIVSMARLASTAAGGEEVTASALAGASP